MNSCCICFYSECAGFGEASSAGGPFGPGEVAGPSDLNIKQIHHDQGIQLLKV